MGKLKPHYALFQVFYSYIGDLYLMTHFLKRTWAQIDLDALRENYLSIRALTNPKSMMMCVIKADAYGHGAKVVAKEYEQLSADWFAVSNLEEAFQLRNSIIKRPILILGYTPANMAEELSTFNISQAVFSEQYANQLSEFAVKNGVKVNIHIKLDTGMSRIGFMFQNPALDMASIDAIERICKLDGLVLQGLFTHFAVSDEYLRGATDTKTQFQNFAFARDELKKRGIVPEICHCSNSGAILNYPELGLDMVRAGLILYGLLPSSDLALVPSLKTVMQLKAVVSQVKEVPKGTAVGYGRTFTTTSGTTKIATVPIGYADGYLRKFSSSGACMLVNGTRVPVIGRICMDQLMLDVSDVPGVCENSTVTVFGCDGNAEITIDELAGLSDTINYELICLLSKRVPRIYLRDGHEVQQLNYICPSIY